VIKENVGTSWRTPYKHDLLRRALGREVAARPPHGNAVRRLYDMTAGDGIASGDWLTGCSPGLFVKYAMHAADDHNHTADVTLVEKAETHYKSLLAVLREQLPSFGWTLVGNTADTESWHYEGGWCRSLLEVRYGDARALPIERVNSGDVVFVNNDPNHMEDFALPEHFIGQLAGRGALVSSMSTMGCNVGGLKRLDNDERLRWYDLLDQIQTGMPTNHNMVVARLVRTADGNKDASYWGYALHGPKVWTPNITDDMRKAFKGCELDVGIDDAGRRRVIDDLFLTKEERGVA